MSVAQFRESVGTNLGGLVAQLRARTGRTGAEESAAWTSSLPKLAEALAVPALAPLHVYFAGAGFLSLEYQLPAASSWCDAVLLGRKGDRRTAVVVELKDWLTRSDHAGPYEGLIQHGGHLKLHPSEQVRGYVEYCRRFHSAVQDHHADVQGCVLLTKDYFATSYGEPPNDRLAHDYPFFTMSPVALRETLPAYLVKHLDSADERFARDFVDGCYRQDRSFVRQIGAQVLDPAKSPFVLLDSQRLAFAMIRSRIEESVLKNGRPKKQVMIIEGPPGSGKSVLAARLWASLVTDERLPEGSAVITTTSTAQTSNWSRLLQMAATETAARGVVKRAAGYVPVSTHRVGQLRKQHGPDFIADPEKWRENVQVLRDWGVQFQDGARDEQYLVSVVDEAHALINPERREGRGQFGFAPTLGPLAWHIIRTSTVSVFLLDSEQGFRDRENTSIAEIRKWAAELGAEVGESVSLIGAQFRCAGSVEYVSWLEALLQGEAPGELANRAHTWRSTFDVRVLKSPAMLESALRERTAKGETCRLLASYARKWATKTAEHPHRLPAAQQDFHERYRDGSQPRYWSKIWNFVPNNGSDYTWFIQAPAGTPMHKDPLCEVGCPYAVRGFDFDRVGVLWLSDVVRRSGKWVVNLDHVFDTGLSSSLAAAQRERRQGKAHARLLRALQQGYRILMTRGIKSCYLWIEDDETRDYLVTCLGD